MRSADYLAFYCGALPYRRGGLDILRLPFCSHGEQLGVTNTGRVHILRRYIKQPICDPKRLNNLRECRNRAEVSEHTSAFPHGIQSSIPDPPNASFLGSTFMSTGARILRFCFAQRSPARRTLSIAAQTNVLTHVQFAGRIACQPRALALCAPALEPLFSTIWRSPGSPCTVASGLHSLCPRQQEKCGSFVLHCGVPVPSW
jgi:hypothetical protein